MFHKNIMMEKREERKENRATDSAGASFPPKLFFKKPYFCWFNNPYKRIPMIYISSRTSLIPVQLLLRSDMTDF